MIDTADAPIDKWSLTFVGDELGANEAHVWRASLDQLANVIAKLAPLLSQDDYQRAMRYYRPIDRDRFIVGRGILREIVSAYLALPPGQLRFTYNRVVAMNRNQRNSLISQELAAKRANFQLLVSAPNFQKTPPVKVFLQWPNVGPETCEREYEQ